MIFEAIINSRGEKRLAHSQDYYGCAYNPATNAVHIMTVPLFEQNENGEWHLINERKLPANTNTDGNPSWEGFGCEDFRELYQELIQRNLTISQELKQYIEQIVLPRL